MARLQAHWVYGGTLAGVLLLVLAPLFAQGWTGAATLVFLALPAYMLHQYEEHDADRFRQFINALFGGREALSTGDVFWINILGVWLTLALGFWAALRIDPGWGVFAAWFILVNGLAHLGQALALRRPNPGVWTGALIFLPLGVLILLALRAEATFAQQVVSLGLVLALHAAILLRVRSNLSRRAA